jgi:hypothetical protein
MTNQTENTDATNPLQCFDKTARAQIILTILDDGRLLLKAYRMGRWNTNYANGEDSVLNEIPKLLAELREETRDYYPLIPRGKAAR